MKAKLTILAIAILLSALSSSCSRNKPVVRGSVSPKSSLAGEYEGAPSWVMSKTCEEPWVKNPEQNLCGVGQRVIQSIRRKSLAQNVAEADGAAQIAQILSRRTESLVKRYQAEWVQETDMTSTEFEDKASEAIRQVARMDLPGVKSAATWISPNNNLYVLMVASPDSVSKAIEGMTGLDARIRSGINRRSDELFRELDEAR